ncbi:MAG: hypothetical protein COB83_02355 [Gammaproteobacteria bacterium]|nr:MAG: hypothetical protein COB83_02355 [Gammaproteobacteria bacterium]
MTDIERDLDFILLKTQQLFDIIEREEYPRLETKELVRQQLIAQFFLNYSADEIVAVGDKLQLLIDLSTKAAEQCESLFEQTKQDILKVKQVNKIKKAYK